MIRPLDSTGGFQVTTTEFGESTIACNTWGGVPGAENGITTVIIDNNKR